EQSSPPQLVRVALNQHLTVLAPQCSPHPGRNTALAKPIEHSTANNRPGNKVRQPRNSWYSALQTNIPDFIEQQGEQNGNRKAQHQLDAAHPQGIAYGAPKTVIRYKFLKVL